MDFALTRAGAAALAAASLLLCACAIPSGLREGRPVLKALEFEGNHGLSDGELRSKIVTAPTSGFFSKTVRWYDDDLFALDQRRIVRWYNEKGWYEAKIDHVDVVPDDEGRVTVVVHVDEGPRTQIDEVRLTNVPDLTHQELDEIASRLPLHRGDWFDEDLYEKAKDVFRAQLKDHGFAEADVEGQVRVDMQTSRARLELLAHTGKRYKFGKVVVTGNRAVPTDEIARATGIEKGEPFSQTRLQIAQQRVYNLGTFSGVRVGLEPLGQSDVAAVRVNVREAPFETIRLGIGLQIEESRVELPRLRAEYANRNFFGGIRRLELSSTAGYAFTPSITRPDKTGITTISSAQLTLPNVLFPGLDFVNRAEFAREIQSGFNYNQVAARTGFLFRFGRHTFAPSLNFVRYFDAALDLSLGELLTRGSGGANVGLLTNCLPSCTLTYPELRYVYDARDSAIEPTDGLYIQASVAQTLKPGSFTYLRIEPEVRAYVPVGRLLVLAGRAYYGALILPPGSDPLSSPFTQRFFGGGQSWQRGYAPFRQGPKVGADFRVQNLPIAQGAYATRGVPVGGNGAILLSGEARIYTGFILRNTAIVTFVDASRVSPSFELPFTQPLEVAPGLGLRYITPFGPIRLDVAYLLNPQDVTAQAGGALQNPTPISATCGGGPCISEPRWAYHLTLGEAF